MRILDHVAEEIKYENVKMCANAGHGTYNATVQLDKENYTRTLTDEEFETVYSTNPESVAYGDCLIGTGGKLYPVVELKQDLLRLGCSKWTVTLDMCRNEGNRGIRMKSVRKVALRSEFYHRKNLIRIS